MASSIQLSMRRCRENGWLADICQQFSGGKRHDLFGWMDIIVIDGNRLIGVNACWGSDKAAHVRKYAEDFSTRSLIQAWRGVACHPEAQLWVWTKKKIKRGGVAYRWQCKEVDLYDAINQKTS